MSLEAFIHHLHFDTEQVRPSDLEVDWEDAPLPYKLYRGLPVISLPAEIPMALRDHQVRSEQQELSLSQWGAMLWYTFGITQVSQTVLPVSTELEESYPIQSNRRFLPSGGALYPSELYLYLKQPGIAHGIYHYDVAHHRLILLRKGNFDQYLSSVLGADCLDPDFFGTVIVTTYFWKNFYKYHHFSYRLQGLDAGVLLGQLLAATNDLGISVNIHYQFLDRAMNHLLGISDQEESTYAVVSLLGPAKALHDSLVVSRPERRSDVTATYLTTLVEAITPPHYVRSKRIKDFALLQKMNEAAMLESTCSFVRSESDTTKEQRGPFTSRSAETRIALPANEPSDAEFTDYCRQRFSPEMDFLRRKVSLRHVSQLLLEGIGAFSYRHDLGAGQDDLTGRLALYVCLNHVDGLPDGAYRYDPREHELCAIHFGDHRPHLQAGMTLDNVNLHQVPLCFHVVGDRDHLARKWGHRGYRIQQMETGIVVHRLLMAAFRCGMGGHPLLGYDVRHCDELYQLEQEGKTCLIQVPVGHFRPRTRLQGGLHG